MADLFGVKWAAATRVRRSMTCAARFQGCVDHRCQRIQEATVTPLDETGCRIGAKTQWRPGAVTRWLPFYRVSPQRGRLMEGLLGILVPDHGKPDDPLQGGLACSVPRTPSACAASLDRERAGVLGVAEATPSAPGLSGPPPRPRTR